MLQLSILILFYSTVLISAKDELLSVFIESESGVKNITSLSETVTLGTNFTLKCSWTSSKNLNITHDEIWTRDIDNVNIVKQSQRRILGDKSETKGLFQIEFKPVRFDDQGTYVCSSKTYNSSRSLQLIVKLRSRKKRGHYNFPPPNSGYPDLPKDDAFGPKGNNFNEDHSFNVHDDSYNKNHLNDWKSHKGDDDWMKKNNDDEYQPHPEFSSKKKNTVVYILAILGSLVLIFLIIVCAVRCKNKRHQPLPTTEPPCTSTNRGNQNRSNQGNRNHPNQSNRNQTNENSANRGNQSRSHTSQQSHCNPTTTVHRDANGVTITTTTCTSNATGGNLDGFNSNFSSNFTSTGLPAQNIFNEVFNEFNSSSNVPVQNMFGQFFDEFSTTNMSSPKKETKPPAKSPRDSDLPPSYNDATKNSSYQPPGASGSNLPSAPPKSDNC